MKNVIILLASLAVLTMLSGASEAQNQKTGVWTAIMEDGSEPTFSDPFAGCKASHDSFGVNDGLIVDVYWNRYASDGSVVGMSCDANQCTPESCYGYHGTTGIVYLTCPDDVNGEGYTRVNSGPYHCAKADEPAGQKCMGDPIEVVSGTLMENLSLAQTADGLISIDLNFSSRSQFQGQMANGWRHNFERDIISEAIMLILRTGSQEDYYFTKTYGNNYFISDIKDGQWKQTYAPGHEIPETLIKNQNDELEFKRTDGSVETFVFDSSRNVWELDSVNYPGGYEQSFSYNSLANETTMTDSFGRTVIYRFNAAGLIYEIEDFAGRAYRFEYSSENTPFSGNLDHYQSARELQTAVLSKIIFPDSTPGTDVDNPTYTFHYEDTSNPIHLTGKTDERGIRVATWSYVDGQPVSYDGPGGYGSVTIDYDDRAQTRTVTNSKGHEQIVRYEKSSRGVKMMTAVEGQGSSNCAPANVSYVIQDGHIIEQKSEEGQTTVYVRNDEGFPTSVTEGQGTASERVTLIEWNTSFYKPSKITTPELETTYSFNSAGNVTQILETDLLASGSRTTSISYTSEGLVSSVNGPLSGTGDTVSFTYDTDGYLQSVANELGQVTTINSLTASGYPANITDPNGTVTVMTYNERDWLTSVTMNANGGSSRTTSFLHDDSGNIIETTFPSGGKYFYTYNDAGNVSSLSTSAGETISYTYDVEGNMLSQERGASGQGTSFSETYVYDDIHRLINIVSADSHVTELTYDRSNRLTGLTNPLLQTTSYGFDALNRVIAMTDPEGDIELTGLDASGDVSSFSDGNSITTNFTRNGFGDLLQEVSPDRGTRTYVRDNAGRATQITDSAGNTINYTYDLLGRIIAESYVGNSALNRTYAYDTGANGIGQLASVTDGSGTHQYTYNAFGELLTEVRTFAGTSISATTVYTYDSMGAIATVLYPGGHIFYYTNDAFSRTENISARMDDDPQQYVYGLVSLVTRKPFGPVSGYELSSSGITEAYSYDQNYRLENHTAGWSGYLFVIDHNLYYDNASQITGIQDMNDDDRSGWYGHTPDGRLWYAVGPWGDFGFEYDDAGNRARKRTTLTGGAYAFDNYAYVTGTNRLDEITDDHGASLRSLTYLATGAVATDTHSGTTYQYGHDESGRLVSVTSGSTLLAKLHL